MCGLAVCSIILSFFYDPLWDNLFSFFGAFWRKDGKTVRGNLLSRILYLFLDKVLSNNAVIHFHKRRLVLFNNKIY